MQKTAYDVRISDWSSDVCSSDLAAPACHHPQQRPQGDPMSKSFPVRHALSAAVLALFLTGAATETFAQSASDAFNVGRKGRKAEKEARQEKAQAKAEAKYPEATREEPEAKASAKLSKDLKKIFDAYEADDAASVVPLADEMIANEKANAYERSISARLAAASLIGEDDAKAMAYLQKALEFNGLSTNETGRAPCRERGSQDGENSGGHG